MTDPAKSLRDVIVQEAKPEGPSTTLEERRGDKAQSKNSPTLAAAVDLANRGWSVFPVRGKIPWIPKEQGGRGCLDATQDVKMIEGWWGRWPSAGIGLATGAPSGVWVLDVDGQDGERALRALEREHGDLPSTVEALTPRGRHLYWRLPPQVDLRCSASRVASGIDVRGTGGYVVAPPSRHPDGGWYAWEVTGHPEDQDVADAPPWLLELVTTPPATNGVAPPVAMEQVIHSGQRNASLTSLAGTMRRRGMEAPEIEAALSAINARRCIPPLPEEEVRKIAENMARYAPAALTGEHTLTDTGNAARLAALHGERLRYIAPWRKWLIFAAAHGAWTLDHADVKVRELAKDVGRHLKAAAANDPDEQRAKKKFAFAFRSLSARGISGMVDLARGIDGIPLEHEDLDRNGWLLGVKNGVVDLSTGHLREADPDDLMTRQCPISWDQDATAPRWQQAMVEWFPDPDLRAYVKRVAGSVLVGSQRDHVFVVHYGGGRNGKGTLTRALQRVLGPYAVVIHLSLLVEQKYSEHDTIKAALFRARLAVASETQRRIRLDEASVKNLTGGDRITARRMREDPWEFDPTHSLWLLTNHLPEIGGRDTGIWSRIRVVKWESTFAGKAQDNTLDDKLADEAPGILRWLVEGCLEWQKLGLAEPEAVIRDTLAYRKAEDTFSRFAAETGLVFRRDLEIQASELQRLLTEWAEAEGIDAPRQEIGAWLNESGAHQRRKKRNGL